ncbi:hypothetical protein ACFL0W_05350 [Nanoarchaeota archaeon]
MTKSFLKKPNSGIIWSLITSIGLHSLFFYFVKDKHFEIDTSQISRNPIAQGYPNANTDTGVSDIVSGRGTVSEDDNGSTNHSDYIRKNGLDMILSTEDASPEFVRPKTNRHSLFSKYARDSGDLEGLEIVTEEAYGDVYLPILDFDPVELPSVEDEYLRKDDVIYDSVPADYTLAELLVRENKFKERLRKDFSDCKLDDIPFSEFIISAEYFMLSKFLINSGLMPSFTLEDALEKYDAFFNNVTDTIAQQGLKPSDDEYKTVKIALAKYAEGKIYDIRKGGLVLNLLYYGDIDCQSGANFTVGMLSDLLPNLELGINRGFRRTEGFGKISHRQAFIYSQDGTDFLGGDAKGVVIEATKLNDNSILPYKNGFVTPTSSIVREYYPGIGENCEFDSFQNGNEIDPDIKQDYVARNIHHPLKTKSSIPPILLDNEKVDALELLTRKPVKDEHPTNQNDQYSPNSSQRKPLTQGPFVRENQDSRKQKKDDGKVCKGRGGGGDTGDEGEGTGGDLKASEVTGPVPGIFNKSDNEDEKKGYGFSPTGTTTPASMFDSNFFDREPIFDNDPDGKGKYFNRGPFSSDGEAEYNFVYHFLKTPAADRKYFANEFLRSHMAYRWRQVDTKRPLTMDFKKPSYSDLLATFAENPKQDDILNLGRGSSIKARQVLQHELYLRAKAKSQNTKAPKKASQQTIYKKHVLETLLTAPICGSFCVTYTPEADYREIAQNILDNSISLEFDYRNLSIEKTPHDVEYERRADGTSSRRFAFERALDLNADSAEYSALMNSLEKRSAIIKKVFSGDTISSAEANLVAARNKYEEPGAVDYSDSLMQNGINGLSKGVIQYGIDFWGEQRTIELFADYVERSDIDVSREQSIEMFEYLDRRTLLEESKEKINDLATFILDSDFDNVIRAAAAQHLYHQGLLDEEDVTPVYLNYLSYLLANSETTETEVSALLYSGLDPEQARDFFSQNIDEIFSSKNYQKNHRGFIELEEFYHIAGLLGDKESQSNIIQNLRTYSERFFAQAKLKHEKEESIENLNYGSLLNSLYTLASLDASFNDSVFLRKVTEFGAADPVGQLIIPMVRDLYNGQFENMLERVINSTFDELDDVMPLSIKDKEISNKDNEKWMNSSSRTVGLEEYKRIMRISRDSQKKYEDGLEARVKPRSDLLTYCAYVLYQEGKTDQAIDLLAKLNKKTSVFSGFGLYSNESVELYAFLLRETGREPEEKFIHGDDLSVGFGSTFSLCGPISPKKKIASYGPVTQSDRSYYRLLLDQRITPEKAAEMFEEEYDVVNTFLGGGVLTSYAFRTETVKNLTLEKARQYLHDSLTDLPQLNEDEFCTYEGEDALQFYLGLRAIPKELPEWLFKLANSRYEQEIRLIEAVEPNLEKIANMKKGQPDWGYVTFSTNNAYATLLLYKSGYLDVSQDGHFVETTKYAEMMERINSE